MASIWVREPLPAWDRDKVRIIGEAPRGIFDARFARCVAGESLPSSWWRVEDDGRVIGYGWMDVVWGDAEIVIATDPKARQRGVGAFILENLEREAKEVGVHGLYNSVRPTHPDRAAVQAWLEKRGFVSRDDGSLFKKLGR